MKKRTVALMILLGVAATWTALRAQATFSLIAPSVSPNGGAPGNYTFSVTYVHADGIAPVSVKLDITNRLGGTPAPGSPFTATSTEPEPIYSEGVVFSVSVPLPAGDYEHTFSASDGATVVTNGPIPGPLVNTAPVLSAGSVTPASGPSSTSFEYRVTYQDADGHAPAFVQARIDGSYPLTLARADANSYATGSVFSGQTTLSPGFHSFSFEASDGYVTNPVVLFQDAGTTPFPGPVNGAKITGLVTNAGTGTPVPNASVSAGYYSTTTGSDGRYTLFSAEGSYTLTAQAPVSENLLDVQVPVSATVGSQITQDFALLAGGVLEGVVSDPSAAPVGGAYVSALHLDGTQIASSTTGTDGRFSFARMPGGNVLLDISPPVGVGLVSQRLLAATVQGQTTTQNVTLVKGAVATCTVKDAAGAALASARVVLSGPDTWVQGYTDTAGTLTFNSLPTGAYWATAYPPYQNSSLRQQSVNADFVAGQTHNLDFVLASPGTLTGTVRDGDGAGVASAQVRAINVAGGVTFYATTDTVGTYNFVIPSGRSYTYTMEVTPPYGANLLPGRRTGVNVADGATTTADFQLEVGGTVEGVVTDAAGAPVAGANVMISLDTTSRSVTTDTAGAYKLDRVPRGNWVLNVNPPTSSQVLSRWHDFVAVAPGQTTTQNVTLPTGGMLKVKVTADGTPVVGAYVYAYPSQRSGYSGADGIATIGRMESGVCRVTVYPPSGQGLSTLVLEGIAVPAGQTVNVDAALSLNGALSGLITDASGSPVANASVRLTGASYQTLTTGADGMYSFASLPMGSYRVTVTPPADAALLANARSLYLDQGQVRTLDFALPPSGLITGNVLDAAGSPVAGAGVTVYGQEPYFSNTVTTGADGSYRAVGMPAGVYEIRVQPPDGVPALSTVVSNVTVAPGVAVTQEIRLGAAGALAGVVRMPDGQPYPDGAFLRARFVRNYDSQYATTSSRPDGSYRFAQLPAGPVDLEVSASGLYLPQTFRGLAISQGTEAKQDVALVAAPKPGGIRVTATLDGAPADKANVIVRRTGSSYPVASGYTDASGVALIEGLAPDTYQVTVRPPADVNALEAGAGGIAVTDDTTAEVPVALPRGGVVEGVITDAGGLPVSGVSLSLAATTGAKATFRASSESDGKYRIEQLPAGVFDLVVQVGSWGTLAGKRIAGIAVSGGQVVRQDVQLTTGASLRGVVTDPAGQKVVDATVSVANDQETFSGTTDRDGVYVVSRLMAGSYRVSVTPPSGTNLLALREHTVAVAADTVLQHDMVLPAGSTLEGRVLDGANAPVREARVVLTGQDGYRTATTDEAGGFRFDALSGNPVDLTVTPPDRLNLAPVRMDDVQLTRGGTTRLDVVVRPGGTLTGVITFNGAPVMDARLSLSLLGVYEVGLSGKSDADGRFTFTRLQPGTYQLGVSPPNGRDINAAFHVEHVSIAAGETAVQRDVALPVEGVLAGSVVDALGQPVTNGTVYAYDERGRYRRYVSIDGRGSFRIGNLATGRYTLEVSAQDVAARNLLQQTFTGISVTAGQQTDYTAVLPGGAVLAGKVIDSAGNPVRGATVRVLAGGSGVASATSEGDGAYRLSGIAVGTYTVEVAPPGNLGLEYLSVNSVPLASLTTRDFVLAPESVVTVTVTDGAGTPVAGAHVQLRPTDHPMYYFGGDGYTNAEGVARVGHLPAGLYQLEVTPPWEAMVRGLTMRSVAGIRIARGQVVALGTVSLGATGSLRGQVHDPAGNPAAGIPVGVSGPSGEGYAETDSAGNYRIDGLPAGLYWVEAQPGPETGWLGRSVSGVRVAVGAVTDQNLMLLAAGSLVGRVMDAANAPVAGAYLTLQGADGESLSAQTGADGGYAIPGLRAGAYRLSVYPPSGTSLLAVVIGDVRVGQGEKTTRDVVLPSGGTVQGVVHTPEGTPVLQPRVWLRAEGGETRSILGGMDGRYRFEGVRTGQYEIMAVATQSEGPPPAPVTVPGIAVTEGQMVTQDLTLIAPGVVLVRVTDAAGNPVVDAGVSLLVQEPQRLAGAKGDATTNSKGEARITEVRRSDLGYYTGVGLPSSVCTVDVSPWSSADLLNQATDGVRIQAGQETVVPVVLGAGATITGRIEDSAGTGLGNVSVRLLGESASVPLVYGSSDSRGFFHLAGVPGGEYSLVCNPQDAHPLLLPKTVTGIQAASGASVVQNVVLDRGAVLSGVVTELATGAPVPGASVRLYRETGTSGSESAGYIRADSTGRYLVGGLSPGSYRVVASGPSHLNLASASATVSLTLAQEAALDVALPAGAAIEGVIRDEAGQPIAGVSVDVDGGSASVTDQAGYYRIERLQAGTYNLWLSPPEHTTFSGQRIAAVTVSAGQTATRDFVLRRTGEVKGRVTTAAGQPVSGATVSVSGAHVVLTDSDGNYHMGGVPAGPQTVSVFPRQSMELLPVWRDGVSVIAGQTAVADFTLTASSMLTGVVKDGAGIGVEGARIKVEPSERGGSRVYATTDSVGHYVVPGLPAGRFDVTATPPGDRPDMLGRTEHNVVLGAGVTQSLDLVLGQGGSITGTVRDEAGNPLAGYVRLSGVGPDSAGAPVQGGFQRLADIGPDGRYTLVGIPAGTFTLRPDIFSSEPLLWQQARVTVAAGQAVEQSFVLSRGGRIVGRVVGPDGGGVSALVSIQRPGQSYDDAIHLPTDAAGNYRASGVTPGADYKVVVRALAGQNLVPQVKSAAVVAGQETVVDFQLAGGAILTGRVTDSAGNPIRGARVSASGLDDEHVVTDEAGVYEMRGLPDGTYDLYVAPPVGLPAVGQIVRGVTIAAATPTTRDVQLAPASRIEGVVQRKTGEPVSGVSVWLFGAGAPLYSGELASALSAQASAPSAQLQAQVTGSASGYYWSGVTTGPDGRFRFEGLPAGHFTVRTGRPPVDGLAPGYAEVDLGTADSGAVTVVVPASSGITGLVTGAAGTALVGVPMTIRGRNAWEQTTTDAGGRYAFAGLAPGTHEIEVKAPYGEGSGTRIVRVDVPEGASLTQDISLATTGSIGGVANGPAGPLSGARVRVYGPGHSSYRTTGADGSFLFEHLAAGVFHVEIHPARGSSLNAVHDELILAAGQALRKDFLLPAAAGSISGQVTFQGTQTGAILVALFEAGSGGSSDDHYDDDDSYGDMYALQSTAGRAARTRGWVAIDETARGSEKPLLQTSIAAPGAYTIGGVPDGQYHVLAVMDLNGNGQVDPGEPVGKFGKPNAVFIRAGEAVTGVNLALQLPFARLDISLGHVGPRQAAPGGTINLSVDVKGADLVQAEIFDAASRTSVGVVDLSDDGAHSDGSANDGLYAGTFTVPTAAGDFIVAFRAKDAQGNWSVWMGGAGFTTAGFQKTARVLLVNVAADIAGLRVDAQGNAVGGDPFAAPLRSFAPVESFYADALRASGVAFDVWRTTCRGSLDSATLMAYAGPDSVVVVAWPYQNPVGMDGLGGENIAQFLDAGGRLFLSGQDIGWDAEGDDLYRFNPVFRDYLGAGLVSGKASFEVTGRYGDVLSDGMHFRVSGGDGANNQSSPDAIVALPPAQPIFHYESGMAANTRAAESRVGQAKVLFPQARARRKPGRAFSANGDGPLCGGLRLDNGRYKVIYLAFGLEGIADANQRALLMRRSLDFLTTPVSEAAKIEASASPTTLPADGASEATVTASVTNASGAVADGTLVSFRGYNADVPASARTSGGSVTIKMRAGDEPGPMTVAISSGAVLANVVVNATAPPAGVIGARSLSATAVEVVFDRPMEKATAESPANYTITPALAVSGAALTSEPNRVVLTTAAQVGVRYVVTAAGVLDAAGGPLGVRTSSDFLGTGPAPTIALAATPAQILANGKEAATIVATVTAPDGNPMADGTPVDFATTLGAVSPIVATTSGGTASTTLTARSAGVAKVGAVVGQARATVDVEAIDANPAAITVTADPAKLASNGTETSAITATVTDALGRPMEGVAVAFATDFGTVTPEAANTVAGVAKATASSTSAGTATITARTANGKSATVTVQYAEEGVAKALTVAADKTELPADGASTATLTITVVDALDRPLPDGTTVELQTSSGSVPATVTTTGGQATAAYTAGTIIGTATITVKAGALTQTLQVTLANPTATLAGAAAAAALPNDGSSTTEVTFTLTDAAGRPVPDGVPVTLTATLGTVPAEAVTSGGTAKVTFTAGTELGTAKVTATSGTVTATVDIAIADPTVPTAVVVVADPASIQGEETNTSQVTATVTNALGQPVPDGNTVQFTASVGTIGASAVTAAGKATVTYTAARTTGPVVVTATCGAATGSVEITLTAAATAEGTITTSDGSALPSGTVIELRDAKGTVFATGTVSADGTFRIASQVEGKFDLIIAPPKEAGLIPVLVPDVDLTSKSRAVLQNLSVKLLPQPQIAPGPGLGMASVPFAFRNGAVESVLGDPDAVLYWYDSAAKRYKIAGIDGVPPANTGRGYWVKPRRGGTAYTIAEPAIIPAQDQPFTLPLVKGWQIIGSPYATGNITLSQVKVLLPGSTTPLPFGDPATANQVRGYLWTYNGATYDLVSATAEGKTTTIAPYRGYWVRTLVDGVKLVFSPPTRGGEPEAATQRAVQAGWRARIQASVAGRTQSAGSFGVGPTAYSIDAPPSLDGHAAVRFVTAGGGRAAVSVVEDGNAAGWAFEVETAGVPEGEEVAVTWPGLGAVPRGTRLVLVDEQTGRRWQMRTTASATFRAVSTPYRFRIEAEKANGALASITGITLTKVRGSGRSIGYVLNTDATASIAIKSPTDRTLCRVVSGRAVSKGRNEAYWDGRDERGIPLKGLVLVEITATTGEGATVRALRPAMLVD